MVYHSHRALPAATQRHANPIEESVAAFMNGALLLGRSEYLFQALVQEVARTQSHRLPYSTLALIITHETEQLTYEDKERLIECSQLQPIQKQELIQRLVETLPELDPDLLEEGSWSIISTIKSAVRSLLP